MLIDEFRDFHKNLHESCDHRICESECKSIKTKSIANQILLSSAEAKIYATTEIKLAEYLHQNLDEIFEDEQSLIAQKFKYLVNFYQSLTKELTLSNNESLPGVEEAFPDDKNAKILRGYYISKIEEFDNCINTNIKKVVDKFVFNSLIVYWMRSEDKSLEEFSGLVEKNQRLCVQRHYLREKNIKLKKRYYQGKFKLFALYGKFLQKELVQASYNRDDILTKGVCLGLSRRIYLDVLARPEITLDELKKEIKILPLDRYIQAAYLTGLMMFSRNKEGDPFIIKKNKIEREVIFDSLYISFKVDFFDLFVEHGDRLVQTSGWIEIDLTIPKEGHAILVRWDPLQRHYWVIDSNLGLFSFDKEGSLTQIESQVNCIRFIRKLISVAYPSTYRITGVVYKSMPLKVTTSS